jgi:hypothetical protein
MLTLAKPIHAKAMPVMLTTVPEIETWMSARQHVDDKPTFPSDGLLF